MSTSSMAMHWHRHCSKQKLLKSTPSAIAAEPLTRASLASRHAAPACGATSAQSARAQSARSLDALRSEFQLPRSLFARGVMDRQLVPAIAYSTAETPALGDVLRKAGQRALGGGAPPAKCHCGARSVQW